jgi:hypothetical protein
MESPPGAVSRYQLHLPYGNLPRPQLVLSTPARVFQRRVAVEVVRQPGDGQRDPWSQRLVEQTWSHADPETPAPALTIELPTMKAADLVLVVEEGDNSPLPLEPMRLLLPAYRVRFVREGKSELTMLYGRDDLESPSYDIQLLAARLLGAPATELAPGPERPVAAPPPSALPMTLFWVILALAVAVMLTLIARLVSKGELGEPAPAAAATDEKKTA